MDSGVVTHANNNNLKRDDSATCALVDVGIDE